MFPKAIISRTATEVIIVGKTSQTKTAAYVLACNFNTFNSFAPGVMVGGDGDNIFKINFCAHVFVPGLL